MKMIRRAPLAFVAFLAFVASVASCRAVNPAAPVLRINRIGAPTGYAATYIDNALTFTNNVDRAAFAAELAVSGGLAGVASLNGATGVLALTTLAGYGIVDAQPLDSDLTSIADLATTSFGRSALTLADDTAGRTLFGLGSLSTLSAAPGVATFLATPTSSNLISAVTDETGTGALVFAGTPTLVTPVLGAATGTSLALTGNSSAGSLNVSGNAEFTANGVLRVQGGADPSWPISGTGFEVAYSTQAQAGNIFSGTGAAIFQCYSRDADNWRDAWFRGKDIQFDVNGSNALRLTSAGAAFPGAVNKVTITPPATAATLTLVDGGSLVTAGAFDLTLTATATSNATFPAGTKTLLATDGSAALLTGLPISTGVSGLGSGVASFLATPNSANLRTAVTDETGTGALVFASSPTLTGAYLSGATANGIALDGNSVIVGNGAASFPRLNFTGTWYGSGNSTSTKPHLLLEPTGTVSYGWNPAGTGIAVNAASGFAGYLIDLQLNGVTKFHVNHDGVVTGTLTDCIGLPISTGLAGTAAGVLTWMATPNSANLRTAVTDETGTGALVFANTPTLVTPVLGAATGTSLALTGNSSAGSVTIGGGSQIKSVFTFAGTENFLQINSLNTNTVTVTVTGATTTSVCTVILGDALPAGMPAPYARCLAANEVTIYLPNPSAVSMDPGVMGYRIVVVNF